MMTILEKLALEAEHGAGLLPINTGGRRVVPGRW
jgi:hypothetical protein